MTSIAPQFTVTALVAAAEEFLESAAYRPIKPSLADPWKATDVRIYEDAYSIVCLAVYETWNDLLSLWSDDQANLVSLISRHFSRTDAKAWDGYLVLLTPSIVPTKARQDAVDIQRNTLHVRKLFGSGDELRTVDDVCRVLLPLLPLEGHEVLRPRNVLDTLPKLLARHGVDEMASDVAIAAFRDQRHIIAELHAFMTKERRR